MRHQFLIGIIAISISYSLIAAAQHHARSLYDNPSYNQDFQHFDYVNANAPKQGSVRFGLLGSYDTFNIFSTKGIPAAVSSYIYDSLMYRSRDEPYSIYPLIAQSIDFPDDSSWVSFVINDNARFSDNSLITAEDIAFTFEQYRSSGLSTYRHSLSGIKNISIPSANTVKFEFNDQRTRDLPFVIATLPVVPKHYWQQAELDSADLKIPVSSGPYVIAKYEAGKTVHLKRQDNYWATQLPVNVGRHNFKKIKLIYYRNSTIALQAFMANEYDVRVENLARNWRFGYEGSDLKAGRIIKLNYPRKASQVQGFVFNIRRSQFQQREVRQAISLAYDNRWTNQHLLYDMYSQPHSLFASSVYGQRGKPDQAEQRLLKPFRAILPEQLFSKEWQPAVTDGSGNIRHQINTASQLLSSSGWQYIQQQRIHKQSGQPLNFELLLSVPEQERIAIPFRKNLQQLGINMRITTVDMAQYVRRVRKHDYDLLLRSFVHPAIPGQEQWNYWHSSQADEFGSQNLVGVKEPAVDSLLEQLLYSSSFSELVTATRALDRILLWQYYTIPQLYMPYWRVAYHDNFDHPEIRPLFGPVDFSLWWQKEYK